MFHSVAALCEIALMPNREFEPLADALYRERILRAWRTPPVEKRLDGPRLFAGVAERMKADIRLR